MLNIRTDRLANRLLYVAVLFGVIGSTAQAEITQLGALRQEIVAGAEPSLAEMQSCTIRQDLDQRLPCAQRVLIADEGSRVDDSTRYTLPAIFMCRLSVTSNVRDARKRLCTTGATCDAGDRNEQTPLQPSAIEGRSGRKSTQPLHALISGRHSRLPPSPFLR